MLLSCYDMMLPEAQQRLLVYVRVLLYSSTYDAQVQQ